MMFLLYAAMAVFFVGNLVRFVRFSRMPAHLRWELYPIPRGPRAKTSYGGSYMEDTEWWNRSMHAGSSGELSFILQEIFFMKGVWKHNRSLWIWSWSLHLAFYLLIMTIGLATLNALGESGILSISTLGNSALGIWLSGLTHLLPWIFSILGVVGSSGLIAWRLASPRLRPFTSRAFLLNLCIICALFVTGLVSLLIGPDTPARIMGLLNALLFQHPAPLLLPVEIMHVALFALFLIYFPFTHMTHMYMKYFTFHSVLWDDEPLRRNRRTEASVADSLNTGLSWAAPHIQGEGKKTWAEAAAEGIIDDPEKAKR